MNRVRPAASDASAEAQCVTIHVPLSFRRRGGRKQVVSPDGGSYMARKPCGDSGLVKAIARAYRWQRMLE